MSRVYEVDDRYYLREAWCGLTDEPTDLSDELVAYYRQVLATHTTKPEAGACGCAASPVARIGSTRTTASPPPASS
jgi:hypothetical protein